VALDIVEGRTAPLDFQLLQVTATSTGAPTDVTGFTISMILRDKSGALISTTSTADPEVQIVTATSGRVRYNPSTTNDLLASRSPYRARFKAVDGAGKVQHWPSAAPDTWTVHSA
jgi:hypothetical protein